MIKSKDTRRALYPRELDEEAIALFKKGYQGEPTPKINYLLDDLEHINEYFKKD